MPATPPGVGNLEDGKRFFVIDNERRCRDCIGKQTRRRDTLKSAIDHGSKRCQSVIVSLWQEA